MRDSSARQLFGRFTLIDRIGAGGHAEIWRAHDSALGEDVALKVLFPAVAARPQAWEALEREREASTRLSHPGVLEVFEPLRDADATALPMTLAEGGDLRTMRGLPYTRIVPLLIELAEALDYVHAQGIVHRDLKPGNVLLDARGHVKLADFGVAAIDGFAPSHIGSPFSASPQQLANEPPAPADDVYGFGALAYELLSGYPPFYPQFDPQRVRSEPAPPLVAAHECPPRLVQLVMRMLSKRPIERPRSMREIAEELHAALSDTLTFDLVEAVNAEPEHARTADELMPVAAASVAAPAVVPQPVATAAVVPQPVATAAVVAARSEAGNTESLRMSASRDWSDISPDVPRVPVDARFEQLEPMRARRWPWLLFGVLAAGAVAVFVVLPRVAPEWLPRITRVPAVAQVPDQNVANRRAERAAADESRRRTRLGEMRVNFAQRLAALDVRGAGVWGGPDFAAAKTFGEEASAALDVDDLDRAEQRFNAGLRSLATVATLAPAALASELSAADEALAAGQAEVAVQKFESALRIDPANARASAGLARARSLGSVLPLIADAANADAAGDRAKAIGLYRQALALDPSNVAAQEGLARAQSAAGDERYSRAVGSGLAALSAGRVDDARGAFEQAKQLRPGGREANEGLAQASAAAAGRELGTLRQRAERAEAEERWADAQREYEAAIANDPSLDFARTGRARVAPRAELAARLQTLIDRPERLLSAEVRQDAARLLERARAASPSGPVIRSQVARLELLLPDYDKPVILAVESDNATRVSIQRVGTFGAFDRREIELKPGRYTVVGTREGYRDVRRDITVAPGQTPQVVKITCADPI